MDTLAVFMAWFLPTPRSLLGLGGLAAVSQMLAVTVVIVAGMLAITALITRALPAVIDARSIARTAKEACANPQAERALRVLKGAEYLDGKSHPTSVLGRIIGSPPDADSSSGADVTSSSGQADKTPEEGRPAVAKLAA